MTRKEIETLIGHKRHKFGAIRQVCNLGHSHPSKAEATHCWALQAQLKANLIKDLKYEPKFPLDVNDELICVHKPDFGYFRKEMECKSEKLKIYTEQWIQCVDEVKGFQTPDWKIKSKLFQVLYPHIQYRVL